MTYLLFIFLFIFSDTILPPAPSPSCCWPIPVCGPLFLVSPGWRGSGQEGIGNIVFLVVSCGQSFMWSLRCCESALWKVFLGRAGRGRPVLGHQVGAVLLVERAEVEGQVEMQRYLRLWELPRPSQGPLGRVGSFPRAVWETPGSRGLRVIVSGRLHLWLCWDRTGGGTSSRYPTSDLYTRVSCLPGFEMTSASATVSPRSLHFNRGLFHRDACFMGVLIDLPAFSPF